MEAGSDAACHMSLQIGAWVNIFMVCILLLYLHVSILYWLGTCIGKFATYRQRKVVFCMIGRRLTLVHSDLDA